MKRALIFGLVLITALTAQTSMLIFDFKSTGIDDATVASIHELFKAELNDLGYSVRSAPRGDLCEDDPCAAQAAKEAGVQQALYGSIAKLGGKIILNISVVNHDGSKAHSDRLTSETVEDLDVVIERLARGISTGQKAGDVIDKTNVTENEARDPRRRQNFYTVGGNIGYRFPLGDSYGGEEMWLYEIIGMYEMEKVLVTGRGYGSSGGSATGFGLLIGAYYITSPKDLAFFVGGGAGIEWAVVPIEYQDEEEWVADDAPSIMLSGGLLAFQTYDFHMTLEARYQVTFLGKVENEFWDWETDEYTTVEHDAGIQHSLGLTIGITRRTKSGERSGCFPW